MNQIKSAGQYRGKILLTALIVSLSCACSKRHSEDDVPVVGLGKDGQSVIQYLPRRGLLKHVSPMMARTVDLTSEKLEKYESNPRFTLSRVAVGIKLEPSIGFNVGIAEARVGLESQLELRLARLPFPGEPLNQGF